MIGFFSVFVPSRTTRLIVSSALAAGVLTGCATGTIRPDKFASSAETEMAKGNPKVAVDHAEKAVLADPRNAAYRVLLGNAYLKAGRFESARQAYDEAMELGEDSSRTALSLALADVALGLYPEAIDTLNSYRDSLAPADYGLALALAGQTSQGVAVLSDAVRSGDNTVKVRQNLALAYAMSGQWREARAMAAQDVPAAELGDRMEQWAMMGQPELTRERIAGLLSVPVRGDTGQPTALALANFPSTVQLSAEAATRAEPLAKAAVTELAPLDVPAAPEPSVADASSQPRQEQLALIDLPPSAPTQTYQPIRATAVVQPVRPAVPARKPAPIAVVKGTHLVQLGAFASAEGARRAWRHFSARNPALVNYRNVTTKVTAKGRSLWRVQVAGFAGYAAATSLCGSVKARGGVCLVMRGTTGPGNTLPGQRAVDTRMAKR
ncbi:MAG: SPOR domain-containing protein [Novosphingobium sp.]|nr:SPOR domain-containing protein [Novosphingobium sp.]